MINITPITVGGSLLAYFDFEDSNDLDVAVSVVGGIEAVVNLPFYEDGEGRDGKVMGFQGDGNLIIEDASFLGVASATDEVTFAFWQKSFDLVGAMFSLAATDAAFGNGGLLQIGDPDATWSTSRPSNSGPGGGFFDQLTVNPDEAIGGFDFFDWHHWALVKAGSVKQIWVDGVKIGESNDAAPLNKEMTSFFIGSNTGGGGLLDAQLDDFAIFARALSESEIGQLVDGTLPNELPEIVLPPLPEPTPPTDLIVNISMSGSQVVITWDGAGVKLQTTSDIGDPSSWVDLQGAVSPYTKAVLEEQEYFRITP